MKRGFLENYSGIYEELWNENMLEGAHQPATWEGGAVITHKYRGSILVLLINTSVKRNEEKKEMISSFQ